MTRPATNAEESTPARLKSTLFCWECDHASPVDGDWVRWKRERHEAYVCPDCETTIAKRPLPDAEKPSRERTTARPAITWSRTLRTTLHVWRASLDLGLASVAAMTTSPLPANVER